MPKRCECNVERGSRKSGRIARNADAIGIEAVHTECTAVNSLQVVLRSGARGSRAYLGWKLSHDEKGMAGGFREESPEGHAGVDYPFPTQRETLGNFEVRRA